MDHLPPVPDARARLELGAIKGLLQAQRRRIRSYTRDHRPDLEAAPDAPSPAPVASPSVSPTGQQVLDALPVPALLLTPVLGDDGEIVDALCASHNTAAVAYVSERLPESALSRWWGTASLYARFPSCAGRRSPG